MTASAELIAERLCAARAVRADEDPIGVGGNVLRMLAVEMPPPWGDSFYDADPDGTVQQRLWAIREAHFERLRALGEQAFATPFPALYAIAPDREWSSPDLRRVLLITRPVGPFASFDIAEYVFPVESSRIVDLAHACFEAPDTIAALDEFRVPHGGQREFFVCTHGQVDICCAKYGVPLYRQARATPGVRAWRMSHFGGHRYAPTAWEFPAGYKWAFLDQEPTQRVLARDGAAADLRMHVRGWSGVSSKVQLLDRVGLERFGWDWLDFRRQGEVLEEDDEAQRWRVRLEFESPSGEAGVLEGVVVVAREFQETGCGPHFGEYDFQVPEYGLESLVESTPVR